MRRDSIPRSNLSSKMPTAILSAGGFDIIPNKLIGGKTWNWYVYLVNPHGHGRHQNSPPTNTLQTWMNKQGVGLIFDQLQLTMTRIIRGLLSSNKRFVFQKLLTGQSCLPFLPAVSPASLSTVHSFSSSTSRPDPFARRPNKKCDPYGQEGKPLSFEEAKKLSLTVQDEWKLQQSSKEQRDVLVLTRDFEHGDFLSGASFLKHIAAVAQMNDHFPSLNLERRLDSRNKKWAVVSSITCHTKVLQGLSHHDFFLATVSNVSLHFICFSKLQIEIDLATNIVPYKHN